MGQQGGGGPAEGGPPLSGAGTSCDIRARECMMRAIGLCARRANTSMNGGPQQRAYSPLPDVRSRIGSASSASQGTVWTSPSRSPAASCGMGRSLTLGCRTSLASSETDGKWVRGCGGARGAKGLWGIPGTRPHLALLGCRQVHPLCTPTQRRQPASTTAQSTGTPSICAPPWCKHMRRSSMHRRRGGICSTTRTF